MLLSFFERGSWALTLLSKCERLKGLKTYWYSFEGNLLDLKGSLSKYLDNENEKAMKVITIGVNGKGYETGHSPK